MHSGNSASPNGVDESSRYGFGVNYARDGMNCRDLRAMKQQESEPLVETCSGNPEIDAAEWTAAHPRDSAVPITKRILIVGAGETGRLLADQLKRRPGYHVVGFIEDDVEMAASIKDSILGGHDDVLRVVDEYSVDEVVVAYAPSWQQRVA